MAYLGAAVVRRDVEVASIVGTAVGLCIGTASMAWRAWRHRDARATGALTASIDGIYDRVASTTQVLVTGGFALGLLASPLARGSSLGACGLAGSALGGLVSVPIVLRGIRERTNGRLPPGTNVRDWEVVEYLAGGGWGDVYVAERYGSLGALKIASHGRLVLAADRHRFERELSATRAVASGHIAGYLDSGDYRGSPFLVTEYGGPTTLEYRLGKLDPEGLQVLAIQLAAALRDVHAAGLIHRDVKPSNVVLAATGIKLIDFGISCERAQGSRAHRLDPVGTAEYAAPEQLVSPGRHPDVEHPVTEAADVFSWASTVYAAATGRLPFGRSVAASDGPIADRVCGPTPDLTGVPPSLRPLLSRAFSTRASMRPSASEIVAELGAPPVVPQAWSSTGGSSRARQRIPIAIGVSFVLVASAASARLAPDRDARALPATTTRTSTSSATSTSSGSYRPAAPTANATNGSTTSVTVASTTTTAGNSTLSPATTVATTSPQRPQGVVVTSSPSSEVTTAPTTPAAVEATASAPVATATPQTTVSSTAPTVAPCRPPTPGLAAQVIEDGSVIQSLTTSGCTDHLTIAWVPDAPSLPVPQALSPSGTYRVDHLLNCVPYDFSVRAVSAEGIQSDVLVYRGIPKRVGVDCSVVLTGYGLGPFPFGTSFDAVTAWLTGQLGLPAAVPADPNCDVGPGLSWGALRVFPAQLREFGLHHWEYGVTNNLMPGVTDQFNLHPVNPDVYLGMLARDVAQLPGYIAVVGGGTRDGATGEGGIINGVYIQFTGGHVRGMVADPNNGCLA